MKHGIYLPTHGPFADARVLADLARRAEEAGWDGAFVWDELLPILPRWDRTADTMVCLTAMAAATTSIRLGQLVAPVAKLRPEVFAHQTATLDHLSGGRLVVGVGLGNPPSQFGAFGLDTDAKVRASMLDEFLEVLVRLWSGEEVRFQGSYYRVDGVALAPGSLQRPRIPIWVGADSGNRAPIRRAARWDGFAPASHGWPDEVIPAERYREIGEIVATGRDGAEPLELVTIGDRSGKVPPPPVLEDYEAAGVTWWLVQAFSVDEAAAALAAGPPRP